MPNHTDFNGDGRDDILWRDRDTGTLSNWLATPSGGFTNNDANALIGVPNDWFVIATGDFNDDGLDDLAWQNRNSFMISNWLAQPDGGFVINDANAMLFLSPEFPVVGAGDFDGDGRDELLVYATSPTSSVIDIIFSYDEGDFSYSDSPFGEPGPDWSVAGVGDFNADGRDDILWRHNSGWVSNWLSSDEFDSFGNGFVVNDANAAALVSLDWQIIGTGDFDGDGNDDILWRHTDGRISNWLGTDSGGFTINDANAMNAVPLEWQIQGIGNYNVDSRDDLLWRNTNTGALSDWLATPSGGWINNDAAAYTVVSTNWLIQPNPSGAGEWDY